MDSVTLLMEGLNLMCLGMGTVFMVLLLLVAITTLMPSLVKLTERSTPTEISHPEVHDPILVAVITAAIHQYRLKSSDQQ